MDAENDKTDIEDSQSITDVNENLENSDKKEETNEASEKEEDGNRTKSENERRFEDMAMVELSKPWPPLLAEMQGKPRSFSDTSQMRAVSKAVDEDVRSCTSYMHFPHISGQLKRIRELQGSSSTPHLHHSFSRMHLPHISDPWDPGEDFPTVSVIALAEERERASVDDSIEDKEGDSKDDFAISDEENEESSNEARLNEHAIYTWNREVGRTRSLSEPADLLAQKGNIAQRPRAMSMESADKAKKPPSRLQFQATLSGLEEEHSAEIETESDGEHSQSILVLAESSEMIPELEPSDHKTIDSDSSDEILTRWTRHDSRRRSGSFSTDLATIDENKDEINSLLPMLSGSSGTPSVQALVDEVTKDVIDRSSDGRIVSTVDPSENESEDSTAYVDPSKIIKRRLTLPLASPLRKTQTDYATKMEREAFDKISQWKTKFASKLEDILRKGVEEKEEQNKQVKTVFLDVPMNLSSEQLQDLKKNMIDELKEKSNQGDVKEILLTPQESRRFQPKIRKEPSNVADEFKQVSSSDTHKEKKLDPSELLERLHHLQQQTRRREPPSTVARGFDGIADAKEKIAELMHWHDQERDKLQQEMETMLAAEKPPSLSCSSLPQMSIDKESLEKVFLSLQTVTDTIFRETISRLKGTIDNGILSVGELKHSSERPLTKVDQQFADDKPVRDAICQTSPTQSQIPVPVKRNKSPKAKGSFKGVKSPEGKDITSKRHVPDHVHTTSIGEHFCHKETCVGVEGDTESSTYTEESSAHSCECDFASEGNSPSEKEVSTGDSYGDKYGNILSQTTCSTTTDEIESSSSTMKSLESDAIESKKRRKKIGHFPFDSSDEEADESDACSEIADLLGVYQVYNLNNDRDNGELTRPQAPEPMTYEERDALEKVKRQKMQLKSYKRKIREFKSKNKRLKEQVRLLEVQQREWREDFLIKDNRISDLKREVDHLSFVMQKYKKALEDKSTIVKHKERQIVKLLQSGHDDLGDRSQESRLRQMERQLKEALDDNVRLQLKLDNKGDGGEPVFLYENTSSSEFQEKLESAYRRTSELEQELKESKKKLSKYIAEKESIFGETKASEIVDELRETINQKDKKIKELKDQHSVEVQELTEEISEAMTERDRLVQELSELRPLKESEDLEKNNLALKAEINQLKNALADDEAKYKEKSEGNGMPVFLEQTRHAANTHGGEGEIELLKSALEGYKLMIQRLLSCKGAGCQNEVPEYQEKLETMARLAHERCERLESELKDIAAAKDNETLKLQETEIRLKKVDQQLRDMNSLVYTPQSGSLEELKNKLRVLEEENFQLKKRITPESEREKGATILIEITELQAKLAQRDLEIKDLQRKLDDAETRLRQARKATASDSGYSGFSNYSLTDKKYDSLAQRYKRQWDEEAELHQQELDEIRGVNRNQALPSSGEKEMYKLRQDLKTIKQALDDIVKGQGQKNTDLHNELTNVLDEKEKEMGRQESIYKQMMETREKLFSELLNEKNQIIQMLKDQSSKTVNPEMQTDTITKKIKSVMEKEWTPKLDELKIHIESAIAKSVEALPGDVVADAIKSNGSTMTRIEKTTEETWRKVKEELAELKDFTFEMADAIEKDIYSSHEQFLDFVKCTSDDIIRCVTDEGHVTRKSVLDQLQAARQSRDATKFEEFYNSLDTFGKRNSRELRQARRDVLLAAEAVTNTADELHHLKTTLEAKFSVNDVINKDELARRIQLINAQEEVKELRKTVSDAQLAAETLQKMEQEYTEKAKNIESNLIMREIKLVDLANSEQGGSERGVSIPDGLRRNPLFSSQDDERLREVLHSSASLGEVQGPSRIEDEHRRTHNPLISQTPPSRDYVTLRERLQRKAKEKLSSEGMFQEPYISISTGSTMAWSRDTTSSS